VRHREHALAVDRADGRIVEPRACVPNASGSMRAATAAAEPDDEPPGVRRKSCGLRVRAGSPPPKHTVSVLPTMTAPPARSAATGAASRSGRLPRNRSEPYSVGMSRVSIRSLMPTGMPSTGESGRPARQRAVAASAALRAPSRSRKANAITSPSRRSIASSERSR